MHYTSTGAYNFNVSVTFGPPPPPSCGECRAPAQRRTPDGRLWCTRCIALENASEVFELLFAAAPVSQRARLYRSLAAVFHPDIGGDERIMQVLNAVKERYPS